MTFRRGGKPSIPQPRSGDGRFAEQQHSESDISLAATVPGANESDTGNEWGHIADTRNEAELWDAIRDEDPVRRVAASRNPGITDAQLDALGDHRQPWLVRHSVARLPYSRSLHTARRDPNPLIRAAAGADPAADAQVRQVVDMLATY